MYLKNDLLACIFRASDRPNFYAKVGDLFHTPKFCIAKLSPIALTKSSVRRKRIAASHLYIRGKSRKLCKNSENKLKKLSTVAENRVKARNLPKFSLTPLSDR